MITGAGFSFWNGGLTMLLEREGLGRRSTDRPPHAGRLDRATEPAVVTQET